MEVKFGAPFSSNQLDGSYLNHIKQSPGLLMYLVPAARVRAVWRQIRDGFPQAGRELSPSLEREDVATVGKDFVVVVAWNDLLVKLKNTAESVGNIESSNIEQLVELVKSIDRDRFVPLTEEELSNPDLPSKFLSLLKLPEKIVKEAVKSGVEIEQTGKPSRWTTGSYVQFNLAGFSVWLYCDFAFWRDHGPSPLWLSIRRRDQYDTKVDDNMFQRLLTALGQCNSVQPRQPTVLDLQSDEQGIPLRLEAGRTEDEVIADVVRQLKECARKFREDAEPALARS